LSFGHCGPQQEQRDECECVFHGRCFYHEHTGGGLGSVS
jgi:hypothetical protein